MYIGAWSRYLVSGGSGLYIVLLGWCTGVNMYQKVRVTRSDYESKSGEWGMLDGKGFTARASNIILTYRESLYTTQQISTKVKLDFMSFLSSNV